MRAPELCRKGAEATFYPRTTHSNVPHALVFVMTGMGSGNVLNKNCCLLPASLPGPELSGFPILLMRWSYLPVGRHFLFDLTKAAPL